MKLYDKVNYNGYEWKIIKIEDDNVILAMTNKLSKEDMQKYFTDERMLDSDYDVRFNSDFMNNKWSDSYIRFVLNSKFLERFDRKELNIMENEGIKDYIRLLTKEEVESMPFEERGIDADYGYWTMSPSYFIGTGAVVFYVSTAGSLSNYYVHHTGGGVLPVISLKRSMLNAEESKNETSFLSEDATLEDVIKVVNKLISEVNGNE